MNIDRWLVDNIYIATQTGVSGSGIPQYSASSGISCRIEDKIKQIDSDGESQLVSKTQIMTKEELSKHDMIWINKADADSLDKDKLEEVLKIEKAKSINGDFSLYMVYV